MSLLAPASLRSADEDSTTRTLHFGEPTKEEVRAFTRVLQGGFFRSFWAREEADEERKDISRWIRWCFRRGRRATCLMRLRDDRFGRMGWVRRLALARGGELTFVRRLSVREPVVGLDAANPLAGMEPDTASGVS